RGGHQHYRLRRRAPWLGRWKERAHPEVRRNGSRRGRKKSEEVKPSTEPKRETNPLTSEEVGDLRREVNCIRSTCPYNARRFLLAPSARARCHSATCRL